jgi:hypothetical protein
MIYNGYREKRRHLTIVCGVLAWFTSLNVDVHMPQLEKLFVREIDPY